jgi:hypothetical protein
MNKFARCAALAASLTLVGCCGPDHQRIAADRATYNWFAPMMIAYVTADPVMDAQAKATHLRGLQAWSDRIAADEKNVGVR